MKFRVPDDINTLSEESQSKTKSNGKELVKTFQQEIKETLQLPSPLSAFLINLKHAETPEDKLKMLMKFTEYCRQEVIPRRNIAAEAIQARSDELLCQLKCQQKDLAHLCSRKTEILDSMINLEVKRKHALDTHVSLKERLKDTLPKLQDSCKTKSLAERKTVMELANLKKKTEDLKVLLTECSSKINYYTTQVKVQTDMVQKKEKPLYLDQKRTMFIKTNLNSTRQNIQELVQRVKVLQKKSAEFEQEYENESLSADLSQLHS